MTIHMQVCNNSYSIQDYMVTQTIIYCTYTNTMTITKLKLFMMVDMKCSLFTTGEAHCLLWRLYKRPFF